jgi:hypothetical protein
MNRALALFALACAADNVKGCVSLAIWSLRLTRDVKETLPIFRWGYEQSDEEACAELGDLAMEGRGMPKSPQQARTFYERSCELGFVEGCARLAWSLEVLRDFSKALELYREGCAQSHMPSCVSPRQRSSACRPRLYTRQIRSHGAGSLRFHGTDVARAASRPRDPPRVRRSWTVRGGDPVDEHAARRRQQRLHEAPVVGD